MQARGGYAEQLTFFDDRVQRVEWSPRGDVVLFAKDQGGDERSQLYIMDPNGENIAALTSEPKVIHAFGGFSRDGNWICYSSNARSERYFDVYVMELATRQSRRLLSGDDNYYAQSFSPDGRYVLATRERSNFDNDLFLIDTRSESVIHLTPHSGEAFYRDTAWAPDSAGFYLAANQGRDKSNLAYFDIAAKKLRYIEDSDFELDDNTGIAIDPGGKYLFYAWNDNGASLARIRDLKTSKVDFFRGLPRGLIGPGSFNGEGSRVVFSYASPAINQDIWVLDVRNNQAFQLSHSTRAGIPSASLVEPSMITYSSFDGTKVPAFLFTPRDPTATRLPAIVLVHGGPESEQRAGFSSTIQYFVNRGYVVLAPNIRGSSGFGTKYLHMDDYKKRPDAIADVSAAADYLKSLGGVDPKKLVIMGGSYGGFMTLAQATMHPEHWAAAVDIVGIANWATFFKSTGAWRRANRAAEYGDPDKDPEFMASISPINHVDKIRAPLFVIAGANDPRVPKNEADQMVEKVRARGVPVEYISFPDEGHGMAKRANQIRGYSAIADFLDKYVKNAGAVGVSSAP
jgi:dipeptidyl aminopeptidase/acylaminoacyl peptidase